LLNRLYQMEVKIPVKCGELLLADIENTGVNVIFSCDCVK
ncbi:MAG: molybdopterin oxidoreductase, partial [Lentisphaerae bacterium]